MNLLGSCEFSNNLSLFGNRSNTIIQQGGGGEIKKLNDLKTYLNDTFIQPLLVRDFDFINQNKYNFTYLNNQLLKYKHLSEKEVELYMQIVRFAQECIVILEKNEELEDKLYNNDGFMGIVTHVPSIILKPEFEIYKTFFGMPPAGKFDVNAVKTIKNILDSNLGATYELIEEKLLEIYEAPVRRNLGGFEWAEPIRIAKPDLRSRLQNTNLFDEAY
tara:strand:+ start:348 stop:998 length:651 start_codon:yes stop_codon:yes gene_type:complete